jgi:hypothetical protein
MVPYRSEAESEEKLRLREEKSADDLAVPASSSTPSASLLNGAASPSVSSFCRDLDGFAESCLRARLLSAG